MRNFHIQVFQRAENRTRADKFRTESESLWNVTASEEPNASLMILLSQIKH